MAAKAEQVDQGSVKNVRRSLDKRSINDTSLPRDSPLGHDSKKRSPPGPPQRVPSFNKKRSYVRPGILAHFVKAQQNSIVQVSSSGVGHKRITGGGEDQNKKQNYAQTLSEAFTQRKRREWEGVGQLLALSASKPESTSNGEHTLISLPNDVLARIVCFLRHDELKPLMTTCTRLRQAALAAIVVHFNYLTPRPSGISQSYVSPEPDSACPGSELRHAPVAPHRALHFRRHRREHRRTSTRPANGAEPHVSKFQRNRKAHYSRFMGMTSSSNDQPSTSSAAERENSPAPLANLNARFGSPTHPRRSNLSPLQLHSTRLEGVERRPMLREWQLMDEDNRSRGSGSLMSEDEFEPSASDVQEPRILNFDDVTSSGEGSTSFSMDTTSSAGAGDNTDMI